MIVDFGFILRAAKRIAVLFISTANNPWVTHRRAAPGRSCRIVLIRANSG